ncbi:hypothetical protein K450DRAFT_254629 [Umbelopsis ramanniana AG]|uniref:Uncharacterized protein n=1 Tax=Umbelopsis ramanniana AG TaxID=1314678 RepID=A0AAD5E3U3_UMBRA|nr:uncharacterized protein K450DRAFT_254629 [Umbelopsis ramanniana AG]KAI8576861.1 hypothetical protein K450DRAFT_254629 [Umbelopsis ramanniana AG]
MHVVCMHYFKRVKQNDADRNSSDRLVLSWISASSREVNYERSFIHWLLSNVLWVQFICVEYVPFFIYSNS